MKQPHRHTAAATALALALGLAATAAYAGGTTWDQALAKDSSTGKPKQGAPPSQLQGFDKQLWLGDYYGKQLARSRRALVVQRSRLLLFRTAHNAYENALKARPKSAEAHLRMAELIFAGYTDGGGLNQRRMPVLRASQWRRKAIHHWQQFQKLAPRDARLARIVLFSRALEYTRLATKPDLRAAVRDYAQLIATRLDDNPVGDAGTITSNRAEVHMMLGEMSQAITWYERAFEYRRRPTWAFGLAVAYDRDGQGLRAREKLGRWAAQGSLQDFAKQLSKGNTFFVPQGEYHYYFALLHEVNGNYDLAYQAFGAFIRSGAHPQFQARARENMRALREHITKHGPSTVSATHWSRTWHLAYRP